MFPCCCQKRISDFVPEIQVGTYGAVSNDLIISIATCAERLKVNRRSAQNLI